MGSIGKATTETTNSNTGNDYESWVTRVVDDIVRAGENPNDTFSMGDIDGIAMVAADRFGMRDDDIIDDIRDRVARAEKARR